MRMSYGRAALGIGVTVALCGAFTLPALGASRTPPPRKPVGGTTLRLAPKHPVPAAQRLRAPLRVKPAAQSPRPTKRVSAPLFSTSQAQRRGVVKPGQAYLGWSHKLTATSRTGTMSALDSRLRGIDVSSHQGKVNWARWWALGKRFAFVKATEGSGYLNPYFSQQYDGSAAQGFTRGTYHFALPNVSSGAQQARYFIDNGGDWSADGSTLPGALDLEYNPYGRTCYGLSRAAMVKWVHDFADTYYEGTGRYPVIYTTTDWWSTCTGNSREFSHLPLWIASYSSSRGKLPASWNDHTFWQYSDRPLDLNVFNGYSGELNRLANRQIDDIRNGIIGARRTVTRRLPHAAANQKPGTSAAPAKQKPTPGRTPARVQKLAPAPKGRAHAAPKAAVVSRPSAASSRDR